KGICFRTCVRPINLPALATEVGNDLSIPNVPPADMREREVGSHNPDGVVVRVIEKLERVVDADVRPVEGIVGHVAHVVLPRRNRQESNFMVLALHLKRVSHFLAGQRVANDIECWCHAISPFAVKTDDLTGCVFPWETFRLTTPLSSRLTREGPSTQASWPSRGRSTA